MKIHHSMVHFGLYGAFLLLFTSLAATNSPKTVLSNNQYTVSQWDKNNPANPKGRLDNFRFSSKTLRNKRDVWVYTPAGYSSQGPAYPLLVVFDGQAYISQLIPGDTILDNLIAEKKIPPLVAVFVSSIDRSLRARELPCNAPFADSLAKELLPWVQQRYRVTNDPALTIVAGSSYGGLAAAYAALRYPQRYGNVLSQSGAFYWKPAGTSQDNWLKTQYEKTPLLPIKFYLDAGDQETNNIEDDPSSILAINKQMRDFLQSRGYNVTYHEFHGGHEYDCWKQTFAIGLIALIGSSK